MLVDQCSIEKNCVFASKAEAEKECLGGNDGNYQVKSVVLHTLPSHGFIAQRLLAAGAAGDYYLRRMIATRSLLSVLLPCVVSRNGRRGTVVFARAQSLFRKLYVLPCFAHAMALLGCSLVVIVAAHAIRHA